MAAFAATLAALWSVSAALLAAASRPDKRRDASLEGAGIAGPGTGGFGTTVAGSGALGPATEDGGSTGTALAGRLPGRGAGRTPSGEPVGESAGDRSPVGDERSLFSSEATGPGAGLGKSSGSGSTDPGTTGPGAGGRSASDAGARGPADRAPVRALPLAPARVEASLASPPDRMRGRSRP